MWYVYFLELSNGDIYVGSTDDLRRRVKRLICPHHSNPALRSRQRLSPDLLSDISNRVRVRR